MQMSDRRLYLIVFTSIGIPFLIGGILVLWFVPGLVEASAARVEALKPMDAVMLSDTLPGETVLVEGDVSRSNAPQDGDFIAYIVKERVENYDGEEEWDERGSVTPPFLLETPGGPAEIANNDYRLVSTKSVKQSDDVYHSGIEIGDPVFVVGVVTDPEELPRIEAEFVGLGTAEDYARSLQGSAVLWQVLGWGFVGLGGIFLLVSGVVYFKSRIARMKIRA